MNIDGKEYEKASYIYFYSYYNKKVRFWTPPFNGGEIPPQAFVKGVARSIQLKRADAKKENLDECDLYLIGQFNDETGEMIVLEHPQQLLNCSDFFGGQIDA